MARDPLELLQKRALMISRRQSDTEGASRTIMVVEFLLTPEQYAVDASFVTEVLPLRNLTLIPGTPPLRSGHGHAVLRRQSWDSAPPTEGRNGGPGF